jgi:hypothetical protein
MWVNVDGVRSSVHLDLRVNPEEFKKSIFSNRSNHINRYCSEIRRKVDEYYTECVVKGLQVQAATLTDYVRNGFEERTSIGKKAFYDCDVLTQVSLSPNLVYIEPYAFELCNALKTITFPATLKTIYSYAFAYCNNLTTIYCMASVPPILQDDVFSVSCNYQKKISVYVPKASLEAYKAARDWTSDYVTFEFIGYEFE